MNKIRRLIHEFRQCRRGLALVEFTIMVPVLLTMLVGIVDLSRYLHLRQKLDDATYTTMQTINKNMTLSMGQIDTYFTLFATYMTPYEDADHGMIITSAILPVGTTDPEVHWQIRRGGMSHVSRYPSAVGEEIDIPITMAEGNQVIIVETFFQPTFIFKSDMWNSFLGDVSGTIYTSNLGRPRNGTFRTNPI